MDRKDKIKDAIYKCYEPGVELTTKKIKKCVNKHYPEIPDGSIMPYDFCINHGNADPFSGKYHIFLKLEEKNKYQVL